MKVRDIMDVVDDAWIVICIDREEEFIEIGQYDMINHEFPESILNATVKFVSGGTVTDNPAFYHENAIFVEI